MGILGLILFIGQRRAMGQFIRQNWGIILLGEILFGVAYLFFIFIRIRNPDIWQPWFGGEKFMEFAFLNGVLRSPTFPPVDPHFAGGFINYYYFGIYLVGYVIKLTGIYAEVAFNLAIPTLFALTVVNTYSVAYSAAGWHVARLWRRDERLDTTSETELFLQSSVSEPKESVDSVSTPTEMDDVDEESIPLDTTLETELFLQSSVSEPSRSLCADLRCGRRSRNRGRRS